MNILELKNIKKFYGKGELRNNVLVDINLNIKKGDFISIMGTSGCGKSTLLNIIGCLDKFDEGEYLINGKAIEEKYLSSIRNRNFGFIVQDFALIENYTVEENVIIPLEYEKISKKEKKEKVIKILEKFKLSEKLYSYPRELSGGQQQRVAIARALINNPNIILADEPTGALDNKNTKIIMEILKELNKSGNTIIIVTHDQEVANYCNRKLYLEDGKLKEKNTV